MILWRDKAHGARENMRRDAALLERLDRPRPGTSAGEAILRLYGFAPPGITLGLSQSPERLLDLDACRRDGIEWAVRPTGGRAIFHDEEWTYALAARIDDREWGGSLSEAYCRASALIAGALQQMGIPAMLAPGARRADLDRLPGLAAPCFASTARHEIVLGTRKLVGSAQRRTACALLQQGSILLGPSHRRLPDYMHAGEGRERATRLLTEGAAEAGAPWHAAGRMSFAAALAGLMGWGVRTLGADEGLDLLTPARSAPYAAPRHSTGDLTGPS